MRAQPPHFTPLHGIVMASPVGDLTLLATQKGLAGVYFEKRYDGGFQVESSAVLELTRVQLQEYFAGNRKVFSIPLDVQGTDFQKSVWLALEQVLYGQVATYGEIARVIENPKAVRAVGLANGANPVSIIVPCHRIIGAQSKLTGYGGGLDRKRFLLNLESETSDFKLS